MYKRQGDPFPQGGEPVDEGQELLHVDPAVVVAVRDREQVVPPAQHECLDPDSEGRVPLDGREPAPPLRQRLEVVLPEAAVPVGVEGGEDVAELAPLELVGHERASLCRAVAPPPVATGWRL